MRMRWLAGVVLAIFVPLWSTNAFATLLFSGGEDIDFLCNSGGTCSVDQNAAAYRSAWSREAYDANGTTTDPATNRFATPVFPANSTIWVHAQFCVQNGGCANTATTSASQMLRILDSSGNPTLIVRGTGTNGQVKVSSRTSGGTFTDLVTCNSAFGATLEQLDVYINYGTSGEVTLYANSASVCDYTGNVTNGDGATTLDQVEFASPHNGYNGAWSEVIIATTDTRSMARFTANTTGNGNTTGFSGTNVCSAIWSAATVNDANYGYTGSSSVTHECTVKSSILSGSYTVQGLVMSARALVGTSGPQHFDFVTRTGGTDYPSSDLAPTNSFSNFTNYIQTTNPATSSAWAVSDFQDPNFNVGEESKP